jgi:hypothetical protein
MTFRYGTQIRNAKLDASNRALGPNASMKIFTAKDTDSCDVVDPPGLLAWLTLPNPPFKPAANGVMHINGPWEGNATADGIAASWRIYDSDGACAMQGNCSTELPLNNNNIKLSQEVFIAEFTITEGNQ